MVEGVNVRLPDPLRQFVEEKANDLYGSASEYIRELIRNDYKKEEARKWAALEAELSPGRDADEEEFIHVTAKDVLQRNRSKK